MKTNSCGFVFLLTAIFFVLSVLDVQSKQTKVDLKKGKQLFVRNMCIDCHKNGGNSVRPSKPIKGVKFSKKYKDDKQIEKVIREGVMNASMPSFGVSVISDSEMKDLIFYVRSFSKNLKKTKYKGKKK